MWIYEKKLQYPVNIKNPNPKLAKAIISQLGGPDGRRLYFCGKYYLSS
ncbi:MAG: manganese catalase family protein [Ruminococcus sp.]|nr:manganese catalase family protein [Ruminococcus sp.]